VKQILLLRHAKSDWGNPGLADFDRPLSKRGVSDAPLIGEVLADFDCVPELILASPALRTRQTAEIVAKACGCKGNIQWQENFYSGTSHHLFAALNHLPDTVRRVMLVGHNPTMEETAAELLCAGEEYAAGFSVRMSTAGLMCLEADVVNWADLAPGDAVLRWFIVPKLIKAIT
jgi:phosphohistidine phosphatase